MVKNKFCDDGVLRNESDVEQFFLIRLLKDLGFKDKNILTKALIPKHLINKGAKKQEHRPDYALKINKSWVLVAEAKHPNNKIDSYVSEAQDYATIINRGYIGKDPIEFCLISNGLKTALYKVNENKPVLELKFEDFVNNNKKYNELKNKISYDKLRTNLLSKGKEPFEFRQVSIRELRGIFQTCHNIIWSNQIKSPKTAFYEFTKLLFIKLNEDKEIHKKLKQNQTINENDFYFSLGWIEGQEGRVENPINDILFKKYKDDLENEIQKRKKKRIFDKNEQLKLNSATIKEVVKLLEHIDLKSVEEDLNGMVFETFLSAVIRGKALGQFFTPRTVVKFMVQLANLQIKYNKEKEEYEPPTILDGCCGTGGFLIFALDDLYKKSKKIPSDIKKIKEKVKNNCLYGIDASEEEIIPVARMNMYLHGDGGSHIYQANTLDKEVGIIKGIEPELKEELEELKEKLMNKKFDVILTNPPFSMKYNIKNENKKKILKQYNIAYPDGKENSKKIRSLNSNVMFIERYSELLEPHGKLITVIDDSVLNTDSNKDFREFIREKFVIKAIISLPKNAFVNADTGVKTSVLYLIRKEREDEQQPKIFMAISNNIGHTDAGKSAPSLNDLPEILEKFRKFEEGKNV